MAEDCRPTEFYGTIDQITVNPLDNNKLLFAYSLNPFIEAYNVAKPVTIKCMQEMTRVECVQSVINHE
jgi:hypothetical protein